VLSNVAGLPVLVSGWLKRRAAACGWSSSRPADIGSHKLAYLEALRAVCAGTLPRWRKHVELGRLQTEAAAGGLVREFDAILKTLEEALSAARREGRGADDVAALIVQARGELSAMLESLRAALDAKKGLLTEMAKLAGTTRDLQGMVDDVASIAHQTNLLAINAAIEAARAGQLGRGFAVVAGEVHTLSTRSAQTGRAIRDKITAASQSMDAALVAAQQMSERDRQLLANSESVVGDILRRFGDGARSLVDTSRDLEASGSQVRGQVERVLVDLQFQDRVNQILQAVGADIARLHERLETDSTAMHEGKQPAVIDVRQWLCEMERSYTTLEQSDHAAIGSGGSTPAPTTTFF
jgi:methyl-accepting chemotaxis protein